MGEIMISVISLVLYLIGAFGTLRFALRHRAYFGRSHGVFGLVCNATMVVMWPLFWWAIILFSAGAADLSLLRRAAAGEGLEGRGAAQRR